MGPIERLSEKTRAVAVLTVASAVRKGVTAIVPAHEMDLVRSVVLLHDGTDGGAVLTCCNVDWQDLPELLERVSANVTAKALSAPKPMRISGEKVSGQFVVSDAIGQGPDLKRALEGRPADAPRPESRRLSSSGFTAIVASLHAVWSDVQAMTAALVELGGFVNCAEELLKKTQRVDELMAKCLDLCAQVTAMLADDFEAHGCAVRLDSMQVSVLQAMLSKTRVALADQEGVLNQLRSR